MASPLQELVDQRVSKITAAREFLNECEKDHGGMSADECARWDKMHADADAIKAKVDELHAEEQAQAERIARQEQAEADLKELQNSSALAPLRDYVERENYNSPPTPVNRLAAVDDVLNQWSLKGSAALNGDSEFRTALKDSGCQWDNKQGGLYVPLMANAPHSRRDILNAQSIGTDTAGGHTTFPGFVSNLEVALLQFGGMRQVSTIMRTDTGSALDFPTLDDTSNVGALLSENVSDSELDVAFGNMTLDAYKYTSRVVLVSKELAQDSAFSMGQVIGSALGERLGRIMNTHATTGTGSSQPNGAVTASTAGKTAASATVVTLDEVMDLEAAVDAAYRPNATWMFNDTTRNELRQLKTTDLQYHWQPGSVAGDPDRLFGYPFVVNNDMGDTASSTKSILFGDFSKYIMREVLGVTLVQLVERYAHAHQIGYIAIMRFDSDLRDAGTAPIKHLVQAA